MKTRFLLITVLTIAAAIGVAGVPDRQDSQTQLSPKQALSLVRTLNSTEATIKWSRSNYGSLQDVIKLGELGGTLSITAGDSSSATIKDYQLSVVLSSDSQHYQISVHPSRGCGPSFFTNESGVIYQGAALGCPTS